MESDRGSQRSFKRFQGVPVEYLEITGRFKPGGFRGNQEISGAFKGVSGSFQVVSGGLMGTSRGLGGVSGGLRELMNSFWWSLRCFRRFLKCSMRLRSI